MDLPATPSGERDLTWNLTERLIFASRQLLQASARHGRPGGEEEVYFVDYSPPARDAITLPRYIVCVLVAIVLVLTATYAIVGHLVNDLAHDLADWLFGPKPAEEDAEMGGAGREEEDDEGEEGEEERPESIYDQIMKREEERMMQKDKDRTGPLPGYYHPRRPPLRTSPCPPPDQHHRNISEPEEDVTVTSAL